MVGTISAHLDLCAKRYHKKVLKYSIVVPFHNEEDNVTTLYDRLKAVMEQVMADSRDRFELVFVDDGSRDRTYRLLEEIAAVDSRVLVMSNILIPVVAITLMIKSRKFPTSNHSRNTI